VTAAQPPDTVTRMSIDKATHVRVGWRDTLIQELTEFAEDRDAQGKPERAAAARAIIAELEAGAETAFFERVHYKVGNEETRYSAYCGTKEDVLDSLRTGLIAWAHFGSSKMEREIEAAMAEVEAGATTVRAGRLVFEVVTSASLSDA
jgi:hypothetical protein